MAEVLQHLTVNECLHTGVCWLSMHCSIASRKHLCTHGVSTLTTPTGASPHPLPPTTHQLFCLSASLMSAAMSKSVQWCYDFVSQLHIAHCTTHTTLSLAMDVISIIVTRHVPYDAPNLALMCSCGTNNTRKALLWISRGTQ